MWCLCGQFRNHFLCRLWFRFCRTCVCTCKKCCYFICTQLTVRIAVCRICNSFFCNRTWLYYRFMFRYMWCLTYRFRFRYMWCLNYRLRLIYRNRLRYLFWPIRLYRFRFRYRLHGRCWLWCVGRLLRHLNICCKLNRICCDCLTQTDFHILYAIRQNLLLFHNVLEVIINHIFLALNNEIIALLELILKMLKRLHKLFIRAHDRISIFLIPVDDNLCDSLLCIDDILSRNLWLLLQHLNLFLYLIKVLPKHEVRCLFRLKNTVILFLPPVLL